ARGSLRPTRGRGGRAAPRRLRGRRPRSPRRLCGDRRDRKLKYYRGGGFPFMRRVVAIALAVAGSALIVHGQQKPAVADLKTTAEASGFKSTSTYDDVVKFMKAVDEAS